MSQAHNTNSTLSMPDGTNKTSVALSTQIIILVGNTPVGAVQELSVNESRPIAKIREIGSDGFIDSAPHDSTDIKGTCRRVRFDRLRITEAFSRGFLHASAQAYPFDIVILDKQKQDVSTQISTVIKNVWISGLSYSYQAQDWVITDTMNWEAESIFSILNGGSSPIAGGNPAAVGGELGIRHATVNMAVANIEQVVDTGSLGRRGSMDNAGLIDIAVNSPGLF